MSIKATAWAWELSLPCIPKMILLYLADSHNGTTDRCFPSIPTIAKRCGASESTVKKHVTFLEEEELLTRQHRSRNGRRTSSEFLLHFDCQYKSRDVAFIKAVTRPPINQEGTINQENSVSSKHNASSKHRPHRIPVVRNGNPHKRQEAALQAKAHPQTKIPATIQPLLDKWAEVAKVHGQGTLALRDGVAAVKEVLAGRFFYLLDGYQDFDQAYTTRQILRAMNTFGVKRNDPNYLPINKKYLKGLSLAHFFHAPFVPPNGNGPPSVFLQCLRPAKPIADQNPELTEVAATICTRHLGTLAPDQARDVAHAATRLASYWGKRQKFLKGLGVLNSKNLITKWGGWLAATRGTKWAPHHMGMTVMVGDFERYLHKMYT